MASFLRSLLSALILSAASAVGSGTMRVAERVRDPAVRSLARSMAVARGDRARV